MTTESLHHTPHRGTVVLLRSGGIALVAVVGLALLAGVLTGSTGLAGALTGGLVALAVFLGGSLVVNTVAGIVPGLSLLFALSTYALQVLALGLFFSVLRGSGLLGETLHAGWLGGAIIVVTVVWLAVQLVLTTRARIPVYDLPSQAGER